MKKNFFKNLILLAFLGLLAASCAAQKNAQVKPPAQTAGQPASLDAKNLPDFVAIGEVDPGTTTPAVKPAPGPAAAKTPTSPANGLPPPPTNCAQDFDCYQTYYQGLVKSFGVAAAFTQLKLQYPSNSYVQAQCHPLTHIIGQAAVTLYSSVSEAFLHGDSYCWSGYYHGVMEGVVAKVGRANFPAGLNTYCADIPGKDKYSFDYFNCVHGLGHAVMDYTTDELFNSLKMCDGLSGDWEKTSCYGGVFMENVIIDNKNHFTKFLKPDDLLYPCDAVDQPYKQQCYIMQTSYALKENGGNFQATFSLCQKADSGFEATCDQSLGRDASSRSNYNIIGIKNICLMGQNSAQQTGCVVGAVKDVISFYHSEAQAKNLCAALPQDLQDICTATATDYYKSF